MQQGVVREKRRGKLVLLECKMEDLLQLYRDRNDRAEVKCMSIIHSSYYSLFNLKKMNNE